MQAQLYNKKNIELKKHVSTIHCSNALSLIQRKIANALLFHAYEDLLIAEEFKISIKELCELIGYDSHDYKSIKKALVDLLSTVIQWNIIDEGLPESEGEWNASSIIADASIKGSICTYSYSNRMKQLLYMPAIYGRLNMRIMSSFKSTYGLALYENVVRYQNLPYTPWFDIAIFRKLMGVSDEKYTIFRDFKRRVLDKAVSEVSSIAPLTIEPEYNKRNRQVIAVRFSITKATNTKEKAPKDTVILCQQLKTRLDCEFGLTKSQIYNILKHYDEEYILEKIHIIESSKTYQAGKIVNLGKYLILALKEDFQNPKKSLEVLHNKSKNKEMLKKNTQAEKLTQETLKKSYHTYLNDFIKSQLQKMDEAKRQKLMDEFESNLQKQSIIYRLYKKEGLENKIIFMEFKQFIKEHFSHCLQEALSFSQFKEQNQLKAKLE